MESDVKREEPTRMCDKGSTRTVTPDFHPTATGWKPLNGTCVSFASFLCADKEQRKPGISQGKTIRDQLEADETAFCIKGMDSSVSNGYSPIIFRRMGFTLQPCSVKNERISGLIFSHQMKRKESGCSDYRIPNFNSRTSP